MDAITTFDFRIDAWKPDTLPMARLAEYATCLAKLMGSPEHVHLLKIRKGSAIPEIAVKKTAVLKVVARLKLVNSPDATDDDKAIVNKMNTFLRDDGASAVLRYKNGADIFIFPGCKNPLPKEIIVHEQGELDGMVIRVGGTDATVPIWLEGGDGKRLICNASRDMAKQLAQYLFETPIRVFGSGKWRRTSEQQWELDSFDIRSFVTLEQIPLTELVTNLRGMDTEWATMDDPQTELRRLREA